MPRNNLSKSKHTSGKRAEENRGNKSIPSKKANSAKRTSSDGSATPAKSAKNSTWVRTLQEHPELDQLLQKAIQHKRRGRYRQAAKILEDAVQRYPEQAAIFWYLAGIYLHDLGQPQKAVALFRKATRLSPVSARASLGLFHSLWDVGRQREAMKELQRFQSLAHCADYEDILAEVRAKTPELVPTARKTHVAKSAHRRN